ncbi:MAG TPA: hypothetical protein VNJ53_13955 [Gaiellaceae bacterium]|nr:hypothetical protein [Gaiellaceae bacterium]
MKMTLHLRGTRDLLLHNGRLANPMDPWTIEIAKFAKKRDKTIAELGRLAELEARGGLYETPDGFIGLPQINVRACLLEAAKAFKLKKWLNETLVSEPDVVVPLVIGGRTLKWDEAFSSRAIAIHYVGVVVSGRRTMRARPRIPAGWEATVDFDLHADSLHASKLEPVIERAGQVIGLGDWRPIFGTFEATAKFD